MNQSVQLFKSGLRAVALAAVLGGQSACVQSTPVTLGTDPVNRTPGLQSAAAATTVSASIRTRADDDAVQNVVVRDYWRSPRASVVAWKDDENWQGLRTGVRRDGSILYDHQLYFSLAEIPNLRAFVGAKWFAFADDAVAGRQLQTYGISRDNFNCQGKKGCTPYLTFLARVPDEVLRMSHDSLVVKVVGLDGYETEIALRAGLIANYLATVDSVSAARKSRTRAGNQ